MNAPAISQANKHAFPPGMPLAQKRAELARLLQALAATGRPRVTVTISPHAVQRSVGVAPTPWYAAVHMRIEGGAARIAYGDEAFEDRAECEAHAIRVAHGAALTFGKCRDWDRYEFNVEMKGTSQ